jgi:hypothetical protein
MARTWHCGGMKAILCCILLAVGLWADEATDRPAIDKVIVGLNDPAKRAGSFTKDADIGVDFDRLIEMHRKAPTPFTMDETWTDLTVPRVESGAMRFITPDVAMVDGASVIDGAVTLQRRVPLLFVLKKEGREWRISVVRQLQHASK